MKHKPIRFEEDRVVFAAVLRRGVPALTNALLAAFKRVCKATGRRQVDIEGNFEECWIYVEPLFTEEEAERFQETLT